MLHSEFIVKTSDGIELPLRRFSPPGRRPSHAVLVLHGASASSETFLLPNGGLVAHLLEHGAEVWLLDWRGSNRVVENYGPEHTPLFTFDRVAEVDLPEALRLVRRLSSCERISIFAHCVGAVCVSMAVARGLLQKFAIQELVLSTIGLFFAAPLDSFLKAEDGILERVRVQAPGCIGIDTRSCRDWPPDMLRAYESWPACLLPAGESEADAVYRRAAFMFGLPYERALVPDGVHAQVGRLFGRIHIGLFMHAGQCLRRGYAAPFDAPEHGEQAADARPGHLNPTHFQDMRVTLVSGRANKLWHRESVDQMYEWLRNETRGQHRKHVVAGYAHQDLLWGMNAARDVYPLISEGLRPRQQRRSVDLPQRMPRAG